MTLTLHAPTPRFSATQQRRGPGYPEPASSSSRSPARYPRRDGMRQGA